MFMHTNVCQTGKFLLRGNACGAVLKKIINYKIYIIEVQKRIIIIINSINHNNNNMYLYDLIKIKIN